MRPCVRPHGSSSKEDESKLFIEAATAVIGWEVVRILTDPNFSHVGNHVYLEQDVSFQRKTNLAVDLYQLPSQYGILLSHYHADHFDQLVEEESLARSFDITRTPHT